MSHPKYKYIGDPIVRLAEECAEIIHIICKIQRFGEFNYHPEDPHKISNRDRLLAEIADARDVMNEIEQAVIESPTT